MRISSTRLRLLKLVALSSIVGLFGVSCMEGPDCPSGDSLCNPAFILNALLQTEELIIQDPAPPPAPPPVPSIIHAATDSGYSFSTDLGGSWINRTTADGLGSNSTTDVVVDSGAIFVATSTSLSRSLDGGTSFNSVLAGSLIQAVYASGSTVIAANSATGLMFSSDGGTTFPTTRNAGDGLGNLDIRHIEVSGTNVYVAHFGSGCSVSTDGGVSYTNYTTANGLADNNSFAVTAFNGAIYCATQSGGLGRSTDGGTSFTMLTTADGLPNNNVIDLFSNGTTLYVATGGGIAVSTDGLSFTAYTTADGLAGTNCQDIDALGNHIYVPHFGNGVSYSTDAGAVWVTATTANGLGNNTVREIFLQP